jgi:hypothetical protein
MLRWLAVISSKVRSGLRIPAQHNNQREGNMNTIEITTDNSVINYTDIEVKRFIERAGQVSDIKYKVRDFFGELEWENSEATITRSQVNELLQAIQCDLIRAEYRATVTITAYISGYSAESEDEATDCIGDDIDVSIGSSADIQVDSIEVSDVEEE